MKMTTEQLNGHEAFLIADFLIRPLTASCE
jgi:hypothetical protein